MRNVKRSSSDIYRNVKAEIESGQLKHGSFLPTDLEFAEEYGVSRPTVAKAIQQLQTEGFVYRKAGYGTTVIYEKAISHKGEGHTYNFGLLIPALGSTEIFEPICGEIASLAEEFGFHLLWGGGGKHADLHAEDVVKQAQRYVEEGVDGIFFTPLELCPEYKETNRAVAQKFREAGIPMVLLDGDIELPPKRSEFDVISLNNLEVGFSLMNHLMDKGCKKVAFPLASHLASTVNYRWMGAKEAMRQRPEAQLLSVEFEGDIPKLAEEIRAKGFDGVFCYNDALAAPLLMELLRLSVEVPQQLKLCGVDDVKYAQYVRPTLSTYRQPTEAMAHCAVDMMMARIEKPHLPPRKIILQGELVLRGSTGCSADSAEPAQP